MIQGNNYCVYKHTTPSGKVYIGITKQDVNKRWKNGKGYELCTAFYRAILKYGWENIKHEILIEGLTEKEACALEVELIAEYNSADPQCGYNLTHGGDHYTPNGEWRRKVSESHKQFYADNPEAKRRISETQIGRKASEETKRKMSEARKKYLSEHPEAVKICGNSFRGKKRSAENCEKLRQANRVRVRCVETGIVFVSVEEAALTAGVCRTSISNVLSGRSKTAGGYRFEYYNVGDDDNEEAGS